MAALAEVSPGHLAETNILPGALTVPGTCLCAAALIQGREAQFLYTRQISLVCEIYDTIMPQWRSTTLELDAMQISNAQMFHVFAGSFGIVWLKEGSAELLLSGGIT